MLHVRSTHQPFAEPGWHGHCDRNVTKEVYIALAVISGLVRCVYQAPPFEILLQVYAGHDAKAFAKAMERRFASGTLSWAFAL
jgi:hypothetical protein